MAPMHRKQPIYIICESNKLPGFYLIRIFFVSGLLHWYGNWRSITKALLARSSLTEVFCKKCVLENFAKFTGKHLHLRLFFNKVSLVQVFSCEFCEISKSTFFIEHLRTTASVWSVSAMNDQYQYDQPGENGMNKFGDFRMVHRYTYHKLWDRDYALILVMAW